ncbi:retrovirus-related pol polyprotein from transposon TNT 1-94 [Tanacetum coccineum]
MKSFSENVTDEVTVSKVLRSLGSNFDHVVAAIEESKDLSVYTFDELMSSLLAHEDRIGRSQEKSVEKAFQVKEDSPVKERYDYGGRGRGRGRGGFNGRGRGRCRDHGQFSEQKQFNEHKSFTPRNLIQCKNCKKPGHKESECWFKPKDDQHASFVEKKNEERLFMTHIHDGSVPTDFWFIDSGCSSHMCMPRSLFVDLDTSEKSIVRLGDDKQVQVEGKGTIVIDTTTGKKKVLHDVLFVPKLAHNLLSIGQLICSGLVIVFDDGYCYIQDKRSGQTIAKVGMTTNRMFPLDVSSVKEKAMFVKAWKDSDIWHFRYGHLHLNGLKLLKNKDMVMGLPNIDDIEFCEGCVLGKQSRNSFPVGKSWRASRHLELVHADLCGPMNTESLNDSKLLLKNNGIHRELTSPYTPEQNGIAEQKNRTVMEMARSMLKEKRLPDNLWAEAVSTAVYLLNLSPTKAVLNRTPFEAWRGVKPSAHLKVFGCVDLF